MGLPDPLAYKVTLVASLGIVWFSSLGVTQQVENFNRAPSVFVGAVLAIMVLNTLTGVLLFSLMLKKLRP